MRKWVAKVNGTRVSYLYISFIIECECKESVESDVHLPKIEKKQNGNSWFVNMLLD